MEKDIGKIRKNDTTNIVVRIDDFGGKVGLTVREYTSSDRYTGFTKSGTRIPADSFKEFKELINSIDETDLESEQSKEFNNHGKKTLDESDREDNKLSEEENEIEEEVF